MSKADVIRIPYRPRYPQTEIHKQLESHRFSVLVAHRRMGKTVLAVNHLIKAALTCRKRAGFFAYIAPFRNQSKAIAWDYLKHFSAPIPGLEVNESELSITYPNKARVKLFGADNPDAMRGLYMDGCVLDEVAQMRPEVWGEIVRPALADRKGWAVFIGTPKGVNLFSELYDRALSLQSQGDESWCAMLYAVTQTSAIPAMEIEQLRKEMSEAEFRQEFLCDFNAGSDDNLISVELCREAAARVLSEGDVTQAPVVLGVDVARFGSDSSVIFRRQGRYAYDPIVMRGLDNMAVADRVASAIIEYRPVAVFIDQGAGTGVIDRLRQLGHSVTEVPFGGQALRPEKFLNRRMEMWQGVKDWLESGGRIPESTQLQADLCAPTYGYNPQGQKLLEPKDKIKARIGRSPDLADALALTFAAPVGADLAPSNFATRMTRESRGLRAYSRWGH